MPVDEADYYHCAARGKRISYHLNSTAYSQISRRHLALPSCHRMLRSVEPKSNRYSFSLTREKKSFATEQALSLYRDGGLAVCYVQNQCRPDDLLDFSGFLRSCCAFGRLFQVREQWKLAVLVHPKVMQVNAYANHHMALPAENMGIYKILGTQQQLWHATHACELWKQTLHWCTAMVYKKCSS